MRCTTRSLPTAGTRWWSLPLVLVALLLVACGSSTDEAATATTAPTATLQIEEGPLVYVPMGNSLTYTASPSFINRYTAMLEEDFGVEVARRSHTVGGQRTDRFLERLRSDDRLREDLADADVITLLIPNDEWAEPFETALGVGGRDPSDCGGDDHQQCLRDVIEGYKQQVDQIFDELTAIVDPAETLIRVHDFYQFHTNGPQEDFDIMYPYWREAQGHVEEVAGQHGLPVAQVFDDFMGTDGDYIDLVAAGLVDPDGLHPTPEGAERMATLVHDLGYDLASSGTRSGDTETVFDFEQDTLCDWFTADEMDSIVAEALARAELDTELESFATSGSCRMLSPTGAIWSTHGWASQSDGGLGITLAPVLNDPRGQGYRRDEPADFEHHAVMDDDVTFGNYSDGFAYSSGAQIQLRVAGHEDEVLFLGFGTEGSTFIDTSPYGAAFALIIADVMLEEMNWTD
ncbi:MAG: SGNH/GDSL hydrolase family protein [Nitriliruptoraceae bacterium]